jgi:hypothetical protein
MRAIPGRSKRGVCKRTAGALTAASPTIFDFFFQTAQLTALPLEVRVFSDTIPKSSYTGKNVAMKRIMCMGYHYMDDYHCHIMGY